MRTKETAPPITIPIPSAPFRIAAPGSPVSEHLEREQDEEDVQHSDDDGTQAEKHDHQPDVGGLRRNARRPSRMPLATAATGRTSRRSGRQLGGVRGDGAERRGDLGSDRMSRAAPRIASVPTAKTSPGPPNGQDQRRGERADEDTAPLHGPGQAVGRAQLLGRAGELRQQGTLGRPRDGQRHRHDRRRDVDEQRWRAQEHARRGRPERQGLDEVAGRQRAHAVRGRSATSAANGATSAAGISCATATRPMDAGPVAS